MGLSGSQQAAYPKAAAGCTQSKGLPPKNSGTREKFKNSVCRVFRGKSSHEK